MVPPSASLQPIPLSVVIVAKNEAHNLPRCLASVQGWVAEIVVVLNDSTDESDVIARNAGARVESVPWRGYRDTKNVALDFATHPWVLSLDADEEVSAALRDAILAFLSPVAVAGIPDADTARKTRADAFAGARFPRKVWFIDRWITHGDWYPDLSLRLFRRDRARWGGDEFVHERIECDGAVATLDGDLHHFSFPSIASHVAKINLFADLFVRQQQARGTRFSLSAAIVRPFWRFVRAYLVRRGFLDGFPGFYIAVATAFGAFVRYSRLYESEKKQDSRRSIHPR